MCWQWGFELDSWNCCLKNWSIKHCFCPAGWNFFHNATYRWQWPLSLCIHALHRAALDIVLVRKHLAGLGQCRCMAPSSSWVTMLSSQKVHRRKIQVSAYLCSVTAFGIAPWSMPRNSKFVSCWDAKGPSSAEKWYGRMLGPWLEQQHHALAHCKLSRWFLIQASCWLHLPVVLFSWEVSRKGSWDRGVGLGGGTLVNPWLRTGVCCCALSGISFVKT